MSDSVIKKEEMANRKKECGFNDWKRKILLVYRSF